LSCYLNLAVSYLNIFEYKEALRFSNKAVELDANNTKGLFRRGKSYFHLNELEKAMEDFTKAISLDSSDLQVRQELTKVKEQLKNTKEKEKTFYGTMFTKLSEQETKESLYGDKISESESPTKLCTICNEQVDKIQWARHIIKKHGNK